MPHWMYRSICKLLTSTHSMYWIFCWFISTYFIVHSTRVEGEVWKHEPLVTSECFRTDEIYKASELLLSFDTNWLTYLCLSVCVRSNVLQFARYFNPMIMYKRLFCNFDKFSRRERLLSNFQLINLNICMIVTSFTFIDEFIFVFPQLINFRCAQHVWIN